MQLFPMFVKLAGQKCVVVGGGSIAESKLDSLLASEAEVHLVAPRITPNIERLARAARVRWYDRKFVPADLDGARLVVAATNDVHVNQTVFRAATVRGILCNAVDDPERCDFYYPAVVRRGDLQIAISTNGKSPALAQRLRKHLEREFEQSYAGWLEWLGTVRESLFRDRVDPEQRRRILHEIASEDAYAEFVESDERARQVGGAA